MRTSEKGIALIKQFESCRLIAYKATNKEKYYTIGWGHYGADVIRGMKITQAQADAYLTRDLAKFEQCVNRYQAIYNFNQNQFDALVSFAYNIGSIDGLTKNGTRTIAQISSKFEAYNKSGGVVLGGLVKRRAAEKRLFNSPVYSFEFDGVDYSKVFDPTFYANNNPDVVKAFGTSANKLFEHFRVFGITEISRAGKTISTFNVLTYKNNYPDLQKAFGNDLRRYYKHYCQFGYKENRRAI